jgi:hypothetical protein
LQEDPLANVFVYLESVATPAVSSPEALKAPLTSASLFALSEGRRLARTLGASLYALFFGAPLGNKELEQLSSLAAAYGADKLLVGEMHDAPVFHLDMVWGPSLMRVFERIPPAVVLFPAGDSALELAPPLAARLCGTFAPRCEIKVDPLGPSSQGDSQVLLHRLRPDELSTRSLDPVLWEHPIVATLGPGTPPRPRPAMEIGVEILPCLPPELTLLPEALETDPWAEWPRARLLVLVGNGQTSRLEGARALARAIGKGLAVQLVRSGAVVAAADDVPAAVLGGTTPRLIIKLGWSPSRLPSLPGTRLALVLEASAPEPPDDRCDILLRLPEGEALGEDLSHNLLLQLLGEEDAKDLWS